MTAAVDLILHAARLPPSIHAGVPKDDQALIPRLHRECQRIAASPWKYHGNINERRQVYPLLFSFRGQPLLSDGWLHSDRLLGGIKRLNDPGAGHAQIVLPFASEIFAILAPVRRKLCQRYHLLHPVPILSTVAQ